MKVIKRDGTVEPLDIQQILKQIRPAIKGLKNLKEETILKNIELYLRDNIHTEDIENFLIQVLVNMVSLETPDATYAAGRVSLYDLYHKIKRKYKNKKISGNVYDIVHLQDYIDYGAKRDLFSEWYTKYSNEDIDTLNKSIVSDRDMLYNYQAVEVLFKRYLAKYENEIFELPQHSEMAIAMFCASVEKEDERVKWSKEFYDITSKLEFINATPINAQGRLKDGNLISCLICTTPDTSEGILDTFKEVGLGSKSGSGWGWDWSSVRSKGSDIKHHKDAAGGKIPFLKLANDLTLAFDQNGKR